VERLGEDLNAPLTVQLEVAKKYDVFGGVRQARYCLKCVLMARVLALTYLGNSDIDRHIRGAQNLVKDSYTGFLS
jgi:hypothetical protein